MRTPSDWNSILIRCQVKPITAAKWSTVFASEIQSGTFSAGDSEVDDFLGQVLHESGMLESVEENLNYSVEGLLSTFKRHRISEADARAFGRTATRPANKVAIANAIYGGEWGAKNLGNTQPGDGAKYIGRGLIQVTGRANYAGVGTTLGIDLLSRPERLAEPAIALRASIAWWEKNLPDSVMDNIVAVRRRVNGGEIGLEHSKKVTDAARKALG